MSAGKHTRIAVSPRFIFLEFQDPEIHALLKGLMREFGSSPSSGRIHITVRGPYYRRIAAVEVERFEKIIQKDPILIQGAGLFSNPEEFVVYIKVWSQSLKRIWWKPSYPIKQFGFNPHITLYKGPDEGLAKEIYTFLKKEDLGLLCHNFRLITFISKQAELFSDEKLPRERHFLELSNRRLVRPDILQRAANVVSRYNKRMQIYQSLPPTLRRGG